MGGPTHWVLAEKLKMLKCKATGIYEHKPEVMGKELS